MQDTTTETEVQSPYIDLKGGCKLAHTSRSTFLRRIAPHLTPYRFGPRCVRYKTSELMEHLESCGGAA